MAWADNAAHMRTRPGFISSQLHQGIAANIVFFKYAAWESTAALRKALRKALSNTDLEAVMERCGVDTVLSPHIFKKVAVPGICVD
jgi:hypothetical protein